MGGDSEPEEIERISGLIKEKFPHIKTAWYSGKVEIPAGFDLGILDFIKLGPYIAELGGLKSPKTNQVLYKISSDLSMIKIRMV
jgi:anaerobic ribonucleoside-triphosphate reductase activating protein